MFGIFRFVRLMLLNGLIVYVIRYVGIGLVFMNVMVCILFFILCFFIGVFDIIICFLGEVMVIW